MKDMATNRFSHSILFSSWGARPQGIAFWVLLIVYSLISSVSVHATGITWVGGNGLGGNGGYDTTIDWTPNQVPGSGDTAIFNDTPSIPYTVGLNISNEVVGNVLVSNSVVQVFWLANTNTWTILNSFIIDAGTGKTPLQDNLNNGVVAATNSSHTGLFQVGNATDGGLGYLVMQHEYDSGDTSMTNYPTLIADNFVVVNGSTFTFTAGTLTTGGGTITVGGIFNGLSAAVGDIATWNIVGGTNTIAAGAQTEIALNTNATVNINVSGPNTLWRVGGTELDIGFNGFGNLTISGGAMVTNNGPAYLSRNSALSSGNTAIVTGAGSQWNVGGEMFIGNAGPYNSLTVSAGGVVISTSGRIGAGALADSNNIAVVTGPGSLWKQSNFLALGNGNDAGNSLIISNGGEVVNAGTFTRLGTQSTTSFNNVLIVDGTGSQFICTNGNITVGNFGPNNSVTVKNGGFVHSAGINVGAGLGSTGNSITLTDTNTLWIANGAVSVGAGDTGNQVIVTNAAELIGYAGVDVSPSSGSGSSVLVAGGTVVMTNALTNAFIRVGLANEPGTFTFNGGTISVDNLLLTNASVSKFIFNGGVLNVKNGTVNNGSAFVAGNGSSAATLNLQGFTDSFSNGLSISSAATLSGVGTINGNVTLVNGATLAPGLSGAGTQTVVGAVVLNPTTVLDYSFGAPGGAGGLVNITGNLTLDGTVNVANLGGLATGSYTLFSYTGSLINNILNVGTLPAGFSATVSNDTVNQLVLLNVISTADPFTQWQNQYFTAGELLNPAFSGPNADPFGKGMSNTNQFLAGFNPTNAAAYVHITGIVKTNGGSDVFVSYLGASGDSSRTPPLLSRTNVLEFTTGTANGSYSSNNFASTGVSNILSGGIGLGTLTNMVDPGGATNKPSRYYRVRVIVP